MEQQAIQKINEVIAQSRIGVLSTSYQDQPNSRYMIFYNDCLELYTKTSKQSRKFEELKNNPKTHVLLGYEEQNNLPYVEIEGTIELVTSQEIIDELWQSQDKTFFDSKEDPDLVVLRIIPETILLHDSKTQGAPVEIDVSNL